jgi:outer membrane protein assembly factor BamB
MRVEALHAGARDRFCPLTVLLQPPVLSLLLFASFCCGYFVGCRPAAERCNAQAERQSTIDNQQSTVQHTSDWPVFRGNAEGTGVAGSSLPTKLELLWTFAISQGGFESTAAIVDGVVYIGSTDGSLYAIDLATGKKRWQFTTELGFTASAAVRDGRVYIGDSEGKFYCIDAATGHKLWDYATDGPMDCGANFHAGRVLFGSQDTFLYCLNAVSGKLVWKFQNPDQIRTFPSAADNRCFVAGCDGSLHVIDLKNGASLGEVKIDSPTGSSAAEMDGTVFVGTEGGEFFAIDVRKKRVLWRREAPKSAMAFRSSPAVTRAAIIVGSRDRQLHAFEPKTGKPLWSFPTKGRIDSSPVVVGQRVFVGSSDGRLYAIDVKSGAKLWQFEAGGAIVASPALADGRLVIGNDSGQLYCFGAKRDATSP